MAAGDLSPFRTGFLILQLLIGGVWTTVPMTELGADGVTMRRGRQKAGGGQAEAQSATWRLKDPTGKWSPRNPASPYFGLIGRGTEARVQVEMSVGTIVTLFYGEVVRWQPRFTRTGSADAYVEVEAAGTLRRLGQGQPALRSPLYRGRSTIGANLVAYWPLEDAGGSFAFYTGSNSLKVVGTPSWAAYSGFAGSDPIATLGTARLSGRVPTYTGTTGQVRWLTKLPAATPNGAVLARFRFTGTLRTVDVKYSTGGALTTEGYNADGVLVGSSIYAFAIDGTKPYQLSGDWAVSGSNVAWNLAILRADAGTGSVGGTTFTGVTPGRLQSVEFNPNGSALTDVALGHVTVEKAITSIFDLAVQLQGYLGETATDRIVRLCAEEGIPFSSFGVVSPRAMGPQTSQTLLDLLLECEAADGGMLYERRDAAGLGYRSLRTLYRQTPLVVPYQDNLVRPFEPVEDDDNLVNRQTVQRAGGSSFTIPRTTGPLGSDTVGIYDDSVELSLQTDRQARNAAGWRVHLGTYDESRWPTLGFDLADDPWLTDTAARDALLTGIGLGSLLHVTDVPTKLPWLPPFDVQQLVQGVEYRIAPLSFKVLCTCTPARPFRVGKYGDGVTRYTNSATLTNAGFTAGATSFTVKWATGRRWTSTAVPFNIVVAGEVMTVGAVSGTTSPQTFSSVTRAVNGVSKAHLADEPVQLAEPFHYAL